MYMRLVSLHIQQNQIEPFKQVSLINCIETVKEPGVISFAFLQQTDDPTHFVVLEVYCNNEARLAHLQTERFHAWHQTITPMLIDSLDSHQFQPIFPAKEAWE